MAKKTIEVEVPLVKKLTLNKLGECAVSKDFRIVAKMKSGGTLYLGRHEIFVGRDDIVGIEIFEESYEMVPEGEDN